jgi:hypothetical protein
MVKLSLKTKDLACLRSIRNLLGLQERKKLGAPWSNRKVIGRFGSDARTQRAGVC